MKDSTDPRAAGLHAVTASAELSARLAIRVRRRVTLLAIVLVASLSLPHVLAARRAAARGGPEWWWLAVTLGGGALVLGAALLAIRHAIVPELDRLARTRAALDSGRDSALDAARETNSYLRGVSHEMRASMHAVLGLTQLLSHSPLDATQHRQLRTIDGASRVLLRILNDLLSLADREPRGFLLVPMGCSLHEVLRVSVDLLEPSAKDKGLELELRVALDLPDRVLLDAGRVQQVVLAVCRYAIESCERGALRIDARPRSSNEQRFDLSLRVAPRATTGQAGAEQSPSPRVEDDPPTPSGLGLTLARQIVALMGGQIRIGDTTGAIELELPVPRIDGPRATDAPARRFSSMPLRLPAATAPLLVVDADARAQLAAIELLENLGFEVEVASTAAGASERVAEKKYALILVATELGGDDGYAAAESLRALLGAQRPAIIGCTRESLESARARPEAAHLDALLQHPLDRTALCVTLAEWLPDETNPASSGTRLSQTGALEQATRRALAARLSAAPASMLPDLEPGHGSTLLLQSFALEASGHFRTLSRAVARGRRDETARLAERFKERCSNSGAMKMAALCRTLEGARDLSLEQLAANVSALGKALEAVLTLVGEVSRPAEGVPASATTDRKPDA